MTRALGRAFLIASVFLAAVVPLITFAQGGDPNDPICLKYKQDVQQARAQNKPIPPAPRCDKTVDCGAVSMQRNQSYVASAVVAQTGVAEAICTTEGICQSLGRACGEQLQGRPDLGTPGVVDPINAGDENLPDAAAANPEYDPFQPLTDEERIRQAFQETCPGCNPTPTGTVVPNEAGITPQDIERNARLFREYTGVPDSQIPADLPERSLFQQLNRELSDNWGRWQPDFSVSRSVLPDWALSDFDIANQTGFGAGREFSPYLQSQTQGARFAPTSFGPGNQIIPTSQNSIPLQQIARNVTANAIQGVQSWMNSARDALQKYGVLPDTSTAQLPNTAEQLNLLSQQDITVDTPVSDGISITQSFDASEQLNKLANNSDLPGTTDIDSNVPVIQEIPNAVTDVQPRGSIYELYDRYPLVVSNSDIPVGTPYSVVPSGCVGSLCFVTATIPGPADIAQQSPGGPFYVGTSDNSHMMSLGMGPESSDGLNPRMPGMVPIPAVTGLEAEYAEMSQRLLESPNDPDVRAEFNVVQDSLAQARLERLENIPGQISAFEDMLGNSPNQATTDFLSGRIDNLNTEYTALRDGVQNGFPGEGPNGGQTSFNSSDVSNFNVVDPFDPDGSISAQPTAGLEANLRSSEVLRDMAAQNLIGSVDTFDAEITRLSTSLDAAIEERGAALERGDTDTVDRLTPLIEEGLRLNSDLITSYEQGVNQLGETNAVRAAEIAAMNTEIDRLNASLEVQDSNVGDSLWDKTKNTLSEYTQSFFDWLSPEPAVEPGIQASAPEVTVDFGDNSLTTQEAPSVAAEEPAVAQQPAAPREQGTPTRALATFYAPGAGGTIEGLYETSRANLEGEVNSQGNPVPRTLDDVRLGRAEYVTLASAPENYRRFLDMGPVTYVSPIDEVTYTGDRDYAARTGAVFSPNLENVTGYTHDTGGAFTAEGCARWGTCAERLYKYDVAVGDFRGWSARDASGFVDSQGYGANTMHTWERVSGVQPTGPLNNVVGTFQPVVPEAMTYTSPGSSPFSYGGDYASVDFGTDLNGNTSLASISRGPMDFGLSEGPNAPEFPPVDPPSLPVEVSSAEPRSWSDRVGSAFQSGLSWLRGPAEIDTTNGFEDVPDFESNIGLGGLNVSPEIGGNELAGAEGPPAAETQLAQVGEDTRTPLERQMDEELERFAENAPPPQTERGRADAGLTAARNRIETARATIANQLNTGLSGGNVNTRTLNAAADSLKAARSNLTVALEAAEQSGQYSAADLREVRSDLVEVDKLIAKVQSSRESFGMLDTFGSGVLQGYRGEITAMINQGQSASSELGGSVGNVRPDVVKTLNFGSIPYWGETFNPGITGAMQYQDPLVDSRVVFNEDVGAVNSNTSGDSLMPAAQEYISNQGMEGPPSETNEQNPSVWNRFTTGVSNTWSSWFGSSEVMPVDTTISDVPPVAITETSGAQPQSGVIQPQTGADFETTTQVPSTRVTTETGSTGRAPVPDSRNTDTTIRDTRTRESIFSSLGSGNSVGTMIGLSQLLQALNMMSAQNQAQQPRVSQPPLTLAPTPTTLKPSVAFVANPRAIAIGASSRLVWTSFRSTECELKSGTDVIVRGGSSGAATTTALSQTTTFTLTCGGAGGTQSASATVYVGETPPESSGAAQSSVGVTTGTSGASASSPSQTSNTNSPYCDPGLPIDAFITCLNALPSSVNPIQ